MLFLKRLLLLVALVALTACSTMASTIHQSAQQSDVVGIVLGKENCALRLGGVSIGRARVYGHKNDLIKLLDKAWKDKGSFFSCGVCNCLLEGNVGECMVRDAPKVDVGGVGNIPPGKIVIIIDDASEFTNSYQRSRGPKGSLGAEGSQDAKCVTSELCINSKGEISYSLECEGYGLQVSTSGDVKVTVGGVTVPVVKGN
jgi:hypothetical protein